MLVVAQALDDILQFSLQKPVEQVSLLPFPGRIKSAALATLSGVLRPLSKAAGGGVALALATRPQFIPIATIASGGGPMKTTAASSQARANTAFSDRNPYPGCTASAPVVRQTSIILSDRR